MPGVIGLTKVGVDFASVLLQFFYSKWFSSGERRTRKNKEEQGRTRKKKKRKENVKLPHYP